jgi:hypothetical protein
VRDAEAPGNVGWAGLAFALQEIRDQLGIVFQ